MGKWLSALKWLVVAVVLAVFIGLLVKWNRKGGISVEAGFDNHIELTSLRNTPYRTKSGNGNSCPVQSEVVADTLREGFHQRPLVVACTRSPPASEST